MSRTLWAMDVCVPVAAVLIGICALLFQRILGEVNAASSADQRTIAWWAHMRFGAVLQRHAQIFPVSEKRRWMWTLAAITASFCTFTVVLIFISLGER